VLENCPSIDRWHKDVPRSARLPNLIGIATLLIWGLGFGLWAGYAPLDGAVVTPGTFVATGQNKMVQHLEGGIIREVLVKEGELVEKHQVLVRLDETAVKARLARLVQRHNRLLAVQARLQAEMRGADTIKMPPQLSESTDPEIEAIIQRQGDELAARRSKMDAEISVITKEIASIEEGIEGYRAQVVASESQLKLFRAELTDKEDLLKRALIRRSEVLSLQRADARTAGELGQLLSRIADSKERIARAHQQVTQIRSAAVQKAVEELRLSETELDDIREQINAVRDVAARVDIVAPVRGIVVKLNQNTPGGVINPGATILELLPVNVDLIIEARVLPTDIAHVKEGQAAQVRITALNSRMTPTVDAKVVYVSADAVAETDPRKLALNPAAGHGLFVVKVKLDEEDLRAKAHDFRPTPGMPADVFIKTGQRTFFQYLMKPLADSFAHAFRER
jgi:HlyD family secretion protein